MKFVCPICGYVKEIDRDELPANFKCPQCGCPGDKFTKKDGTTRTPGTPSMC